MNSGLFDVNNAKLYRNGRLSFLVDTKTFFATPSLTKEWNDHRQFRNLLRENSKRRIERPRWETWLFELAKPKKFEGQMIDAVAVTQYSVQIGRWENLVVECHLDKLNDWQMVVSRFSWPNENKKVLGWRKDWVGPTNPDGIRSVYWYDTGDGPTWLSMSLDRARWEISEPPTFIMERPKPPEVDF